MLKQRVITAIVLLAVLLPALFYQTATPFCALALVLIGAGAWEWSRLNGEKPLFCIAWAALCVALCAAAWTGGWLTQTLPIFWVLIGAGWVLGGAFLLSRGVPGWVRIPRLIRLPFGVLALWAAWLAVAQARVIGVEFLLSILLLVWVADIGAYFAGRRFGGKFSRKKLAASISPGKSWEGVWGGTVGVLTMAFAWIALQPGGQTVFHSLLNQYGVLFMALALIFLVMMSVVGDLVESLVKRSAGEKDSSGLLPGHGGVLDRIDALMPTLPLAMMLVSFLI
ncbi:MAG: phosphatidate cytidylyltransferase [Polaromonas sp.]|nr:phosphatidate cytidylyltransferase [Polaromonas sp.]